MAKSIQTIVTDTVKKSAKLFSKGEILEAPTRIDVMVAILIDAMQNTITTRQREICDYVREYEDVCKYAKEVDASVKEIYRAHF